MKIAITINTTWNIINFRLGLIKELQNDGLEFSQSLACIIYEFSL